MQMQPYDRPARRWNLSGSGTGNETQGMPRASCEWCKAERLHKEPTEQKCTQPHRTGMRRKDTTLTLQGNASISTQLDITAGDDGRQGTHRSARRRKRRRSNGGVSRIGPMALQCYVLAMIRQIKEEVTSVCSTLDRFCSMDVPCTIEEVDGIAAELWDCHDNLISLLDEFEKMASACQEPGRVMAEITVMRDRLRFLGLHIEILALHPSDLLALPEGL